MSLDKKYLKEFVFTTEMAAYGASKFIGKGDKIAADQGAVDAIASLSFLSHFSSLSKGVIDIRDFIYYISLIGVFIYINIELVNLKKGG